MADEGKYRKRFEDTPATSLTREEDLKDYAPADAPVFTPPSEDGGGRALDFAPLAELLAPAEDDAHVFSEALPDFGIGALVSQQRIERTEQLLDRARPLMSERKWRLALGMVEQALAASSQSGEALTLKVKCLMELGHYEAAVRLAHLARTTIADPPLRLQVFQFEGFCLRAMTRAVEERLGPLIEKGQSEEALALVADALRRQPTNIVLLFHRANLHWMRGELPRARQSVEEARRHVGRENVDLIAELERKIGFGAHRKTIEAARTELRKGNIAGALERLASCRELEGNEHYDDLRALAEQKRRAGIGHSLGSRSAGQQGSQRQQTLRWLVAEELGAAEGAVRAGDFREARRLLGAAAEIAPECLTIDFRHASAIVSQYGKAMENGRRIEPKSALDDLAQAERLLSSVSNEPEYATSSARLQRTMAAIRSYVAKGG